MPDNRFVMVRLKRPLQDEDGKDTNTFQDYVCWIPLELAKKAKTEKKRIRLYFDDLEEWRDNFILEDFDERDPISKERANEMFQRQQQFIRFKFAGRPSFKD